MICVKTKILLFKFCSIQCAKFKTEEAYQSDNQGGLLGGVKSRLSSTKSGPQQGKYAADSNNQPGKLEKKEN